MAGYRLHCKVGKVGYAKNHAAYILREEGYTSKKEQLVYFESGNMNFFDGTSALKFWEYADTYERLNGYTYRELELNIPNEFNHEQAKELIHNFVKKELGEDYPYTFAIHESFNKDNEKNLHCHLMFSERENDGIKRDLDKFFKRANSKKPELGGAIKNSKWQSRDRLLELRKSWEVEQNNLLEKFGFEERVDCRSLFAIRQELLQKEMFDEAEKYNRLPINISGKILYKVDRSIPLNDKEQEKYNSFLEAKRIRKEKIREQEYKQTKVDIEKLEKQDSKESAINILSKGEYFRAKREYFKTLKKLKKYPENEVLKNKVNSINENIEQIKKQVLTTTKYVSIYAQLERNKARDIKQAKEFFKEKFNEEYFSKEQEKIINKYKSFDKLKFKIKEQALLNEHTEEKTINIISNYKYNNKLIDNFNMQKNRDLLIKEHQEVSLYNPKELNGINLKISSIDNKLRTNQNEILDLLDSLDKNKVEDLSKKTNENKEFELKIIRKEIVKNSTNLTDIEYEKERLFLLEKHANLEKIYSKENEKEKKNPKKMYNISLELSAIENLVNSEYKVSKDIKDIDDVSLNKIEKEIKVNNKRINTAMKVINNTKNILNSTNKKHNLSGIEIITIGKLSKNQYWKLYKQQEKLKNEVIQKEKALEKMGKLSFGKSVLRKDIELKKKNIISLEQQEKELIKVFRNNSEFKVESQKLEKYYTEVLRKNQQVSYQLKFENKINYKLKANIKNKDNKEIKVNTNLKKNHSKKRSQNIGKSLDDLKRSINKILTADTTEIHSNLDINLKKDKGYEWGM